jgi:CheY-like chemotaxis protein
MTRAAGRDERRRRVLVAEDEPELRSVFVEFLREHDFDVLEAANGLEALLQVKRHRPGGIVLDLAMPRLGGIEALKHIRAFDPSITVVVVTGVPDREVSEQALARGASVVLPKPVTLRDLVAALSGEPVAAAPAAPPAPRASTGSVLVVDDDPDVLETLTEFLTGTGYEVRAARDGLAALRAIVERRPDVVLLDIDMPGLRGTDALPFIHALAPHAQVVMVSGTQDDEAAKRALALGAFDYVVKPLDFAYLARSLETAVSMKTFDPPRAP